MVRQGGVARACTGGRLLASLDLENKRYIWLNILETGNVIDGFAVADEEETHFQRRGCRNMVDEGGGGVTWRAAVAEG